MSSAGDPGAGDDFQRYLRAKRTVDDRAIDRRVFDRLREELAGRESLRVLDVGAGLGASLRRFLARDALPDRVEYVLVDRDGATLAAARETLPARAGELGYEASKDESPDGGVLLSRDDERVRVEFVRGDALAVASDREREYDLLVGQAFLDLVDPAALSDLLSCLRAGGLWYFPITYDGGTRFAPAHPLDDAVERAYHAHMDAQPKAGSAAGRAVFGALPDRAAVLAAAGSDWVVYPRDRGYPDDEAYFLRYVLDTVAGAVGERATDPNATDGGAAALDPDALDDWLATRRGQVEAGELTYVAHQLDLLGRVE
ncbi:class I SAM-dependent methyltransferase [Halomarina pelagica]|uniref:class I SAM-dependent methyltransferase n=1 Tax=Halomarina pelagica TaxID=2961599 RepID=UPI0020C1F462|nr:class I SAM-dependent methyltransferase [Halomarina sp. BND7]